MFLLKKLFSLRDKQANNGNAKPFIEHLDDLRKVVMRIVLVLLATTIISWFFHDKIINVLREPILRVWKTTQQQKLPEQPAISLQQWEKIKTAWQDAIYLPPKQKAIFFHQYAKNYDIPQKYFDYYSIYRSARHLSKPADIKYYLKQFPQLTIDDYSIIKYLIANKPDVKPNALKKISSMQAFSPTSVFMLAFKLSFIAGIMLGFPFLLFFILQFLLPALKTQEKRLVLPMLSGSVLLFIVGILFAYYLVLPRALDFFMTFEKNAGVYNHWEINKYLSFTSQFIFIFGLSFQFPILMLVFIKLNFIDYHNLSASRSYAIVAILVFSAVITPTGDPFTLFMLAIPMYLMYEFCAIIAYLKYRKELQEEAEYYKKYPAANPKQQVDYNDYDDKKQQPHNSEANTSTNNSSISSKSDINDYDEKITKSPERKKPHTNQNNISSINASTSIIQDDMIMFNPGAYYDDVETIDEEVDNDEPSSTQTISEKTVNEDTANVEVIDDDKTIK